ncbi:arylamine N-acetyltransferase family protein [Pantoea allii]|uniref:arylamine N-acetyltransferase family protein n=1 Tax=Pantoea allii TaxID=574096 RepID=UPI0024B7F4DE|nr:arylamine N-acetyltransferase [Pantoea allii]MDJ0040205.1 arylamine N-acetyltransferase [Pantoea allii]
MPDSITALPAALAEQSLEKLGFSSPPAPDEAGLSTLYRAWCQSVPFDNLRRRLMTEDDRALPLPGSTASDFFTHWLTFGTGGTCWAGHGALYALLAYLGFHVQFGLSTMLSPRPAPVGSPGHGMLIVKLDGRTLVVDSTLLHGDPLPLEARLNPHPVWGTRVHQHDGSWCIHWKPLGRAWLDCKILATDLSADAFQSRHQQSRSNSRFDGALLIRRANGETITGIVKGEQVIRDRQGKESVTPLSRSEQHRLLIEEYGIAEALVARLPADDPVHR